MGNITMDELLTLLGAKDVESFLLRKQITLLEQQIQALTKKEEVVDEPGDKP